MLKVNPTKTSMIRRCVAALVPIIVVILYYLYMNVQHDKVAQIDKENAAYSHQAVDSFKIFMKQVVDDASNNGRLSDNSITQLEKVKSLLVGIQAPEQSAEISTILAEVDNILIKTSLDPSLNMVVAQVTAANRINNSLSVLANQLDEEARQNDQRFADATEYQLKLILIVLVLTVAMAGFWIYTLRYRKPSH